MFLAKKEKKKGMGQTPPCKVIDRIVVKVCRNVLFE